MRNKKLMYGLYDIVDEFGFNRTIQALIVIQQNVKDDTGLDSTIRDLAQERLDALAGLASKLSISFDSRERTHETDTKTNT